MERIKNIIICLLLANWVKGFEFWKEQPSFWILAITFLSIAFLLKIETRMEDEKNDDCSNCDTSFKYSIFNR